MNFDILEVFTRAGKITWKYKVLWIFGILASCGRSGGSGGNSSSSGNNFNNQPSDNPFSPEMTNQIENFIDQLAPWFEQNTWVIYAFIFFVLLLVVFQIFASIVGTTGLARGVVHAENGVETLHFGELFSESLKYFWRLFGVSLLTGIPIIIFFIGFFGLLLLSARGGDDSIFGGMIALFFIGFCCCLFPILIFLGFYLSQVNRAIIIEDMKIFPAFARAWQVLTKNIIGLILVAIILGIGSSIISILISLPALFIIIPFMVSIIDGTITSWQPFILSGIFLLCYSPIAWFFTGILFTYIESVWTLVYLRVTKRNEENMPIVIEANA